GLTSAMVEPADQQFLRSIFLMEAWDTLASIEEGVTRLAAGKEPSWDDLFLLPHRLKGAAALHGFQHVAELADAVEQALQPLPHAAADARRSAADELTALLSTLKSVLDAIEHERPFASGPRSGAPRPVPSKASVDPDRDPLRTQLARFFAESDDVLSYFGPEANEHLEAMTAALLALEDGGPSDAGVDALFRAVHTLKGAAYVVGCRAVGELAHG